MSDIKQTAERVLALDAEATKKPWRWDMESYRTDDESDVAPALVSDDEFTRRPFGVLSCDGVANAPGRTDRELIADYRTSAPALAREVLALKSGCGSTHCIHAPSKVGSSGRCRCAGAAERAARLHEQVESLSARVAGLETLCRAGADTDRQWREMHDRLTTALGRETERAERAESEVARLREALESECARRLALARPPERLGYQLCTATIPDAGLGDLACMRREGHAGEHVALFADAQAHDLAEATAKAASLDRERDEATAEAREAAGFHRNRADECEHAGATTWARMHRLAADALERHPDAIRARATGPTPPTLATVRARIENLERTEVEVTATGRRAEFVALDDVRAAFGGTEDGHA